MPICGGRRKLNAGAVGGLGGRRRSRPELVAHAAELGKDRNCRDLSVGWGVLELSALTLGEAAAAALYYGGPGGEDARRHGRVNVFE
ncbi:hypothetical protein CRG98_007753 [Punica granatum]|uniref:Uncharacterized protein n=1 Tax=Punica granatum TaxID=22663 RepID=A0A2I0KTU4_PUNGR|nr:hypothetical protein CRG98_007753 [Punica granatum]